MPEREFVDYLRGLLDSMVKAENFTFGMDYETFREDGKPLFAAIGAWKFQEKRLNIFQMKSEQNIHRFQGKKWQT